MASEPRKQPEKNPKKKLKVDKGTIRDLDIRGNAIKGGMVLGKGPVPS